MSLPVIVLTFTGVVCASATNSSHAFHYIYGCYKSSDVRVDMVFDEDVVAYADFTRKEIVWSIPHLPKSAYFKQIAYGFATASITHCHSVLEKAKRANPGALIPQDAPDVYIYSRYNGEHAVMNTLFCVANNFYPPSINFTWTRNKAEITEGVENLQYIHNNDGAFHRISRLLFTPQEGDVYECSVQHQASEQPVIKTWELQERRSSLSPAAWFFIASLVLCLVGIGCGTFFFTKHPN